MFHHTDDQCILEDNYLISRCLDVSYQRRFDRVIGVMIVNMPFTMRAIGPIGIVLYHVSLVYMASFGSKFYHFKKSKF